MPNLLVIDDDQVIQDAYKIGFEAAGFKVDSASDGKAGLDLAKKHDYDLILLDMLMPFMGGLEFLKAYQPVKHPKVQVLVLSNSQVPADTQEQVISLGAKAYLHKSAYTPAQLIELVNKHLAS